MGQINSSCLLFSTSDTPAMRVSTQVIMERRIGLISAIETLNFRSAVIRQRVNVGYC